MSRLITAINASENLKVTENGETALKSTLNPLLDLFALGGSYRTRSEEDIIALFEKALLCDSQLAMKCLFYIRDMRGGGCGERRFFKVVLNWLGNVKPELVEKNLEQIPEFGRWDDFYSLVGTKVESKAFAYLLSQAKKDSEIVNNSADPISLLGKWLKSTNTSSKESRRLGEITRRHFQMTHKQYQHLLSSLRKRINIVESLMSQHRWDEIDFSKLPSIAGFRYRLAFARREETAERYKDFMSAPKEESKVNAKDLFIHEIVNNVIYSSKIEPVQRDVFNKYWDNLPNYFEGKKANILCMCDTSGSMTWISSYNSVRPICVSIGLSMYCAEKLQGYFHNYFLTFSANPQLCKVEGVDTVQKLLNIKHRQINENTNLGAAFDLILNTAIKNNLTQEDLPEKIVVLSDMEIDEAQSEFNVSEMDVFFDKLKEKWKSKGYKIPQLVFWNLNARNDTFLARAEDDVSFVSGWNQQTMKILLSGKTGIDLMLEVLNGERYSNISS